MKKRKDGRYIKQITITVNGEKRIKSFYGKSVAELNQKILNYKGEIEKGRLFSAVAEDWWEEHEETLTYNSRCGYVSGLKCAKEYFKDVYVKDITARDINNYVNSFVIQGFAQKTILTKLQTVRQVLDYAVLNGELEYNPALSIKVPKHLPKSTRKPPIETEIKKIKSSVNAPFGLFALLCLYTGCRRGEALALQGSDFDFKNNVIHITKSIYTQNGHALVKKPKTEAGCRDIPILEPLKEHLPKLKPDEYLFNRNGAPLSNKWFSVYWKDYCNATGLDLTPHQLRHAYATRLYELGIDEKAAQDLLGHADITTTRNVYTHISEEKRKTTADMLKDF